MRGGVRQRACIYAHAGCTWSRTKMMAKKGCASLRLWKSEVEGMDNATCLRFLRVRSLISRIGQCPTRIIFNLFCWRIFTINIYFVKHVVLHSCMWVCTNITKRSFVILWSTSHARKCPFCPRTDEWFLFRFANDYRTRQWYIMNERIVFMNESTSIVANSSSSSLARLFDSLISW